jgi:cytochrome P450
MLFKSPKQPCRSVPHRVRSTLLLKKMLIVLSPQVNRNPKLWGPDSEDFVPVRWIDKDGRGTMNGGTDSNYSFLTFLHGPRSCIGERFARAELRALLVALGNFEFQMADTDEKIMVGGTVTSKPMNGMNLELTSVKWGN